MAKECLSPPLARCYYCNSELNPNYDCSCRSCSREVCDNCTQICQWEECDQITCSHCVDAHIANFHPDNDA